MMIGKTKLSLDAAKRVAMVFATLRRDAWWRAQLDGSKQLDGWKWDSWMVGKLEYRTRDGKAIILKERGLPVKTWSDKLLTALSMGPWRIPRQLRVKNAVLTAAGGREFSTLHPKTVASLPYGLKWQTAFVVTLHRNLRALGLTLDDLCRKLRGMNGAAAYGVLATLAGVNNYSKCLELFVREGLKLEVIPRDRHVRNFLESVGLGDIPPEDLPTLIRLAGEDPRFAARAFYWQGVAGTERAPGKA